MSQGRRYSLRSNLMLLVAVCVIPAAGIAAVLLHQHYQQLLGQIEQGTLLEARQAVAGIDRELGAIESALKVLATSAELRASDLRAFHARARNALASGIVYNYVLTDRAGQQVLNTLQPYGTRLPMSGTPPELAAVFSEARPVLSNFFIGPVTGKPALAMGVPVVLDGEVVYSLNIGLNPERISEIVQRQGLPAGWVAAVIDRAGVIVGRSRDGERYVGQRPADALGAAITESPEGRLVTLTKDGVPVFTAFATSSLWGWRVAIGAPRAQLEGELKRSALFVIAGSLFILAVGICFALLIARRVLGSVRGLNDAALSMANGAPVKLPALLIDEAAAVGEAILKAARLMEETRFLAHHDTLTGLPNRRLFEQLASHQFALAERQRQSLAVLAIDLDGFKQVNDEQGHAMGDEVLKQVAIRLGDVVRESDVAARLGGDEFIILASDADPDGLARMAGRVLAMLSKPYPGIRASVSASLGVAITPAHGTTLPQLMAVADRALYRAKGQGKHCAVFADAGDCAGG